MRTRRAGKHVDELHLLDRFTASLKELLAKQAALNAALDLDKGERQVAPEAVGKEG